VPCLLPRLPEGPLQHQPAGCPLRPQMVQGMAPPPVALSASPPRSMGVGARCLVMELTGPNPNVCGRSACFPAAWTGPPSHPTPSGAQVKSHWDQGKEGRESWASNRKVAGSNPRADNVVLPLSKAVSNTVPQRQRCGCQLRQPPASL
jgi:hypothetical protein